MLGIADFGAFCAAILLFLALPGPGAPGAVNSAGNSSASRAPHAAGDSSGAFVKLPAGDSSGAFVKLPAGDSAGGSSSGASGGRSRN